MYSCADVDRLMTPFVDGEIASADRAAVEAHLARCASCQRRAAIEAAARDAVRSHAASLVEASAARAPLDLRARCAAAARDTEAVSVGFARLAAAAVVLLAVAGVLALVLTRTSTTVMAAQLTVDHLKCTKLFPIDHANDDRRAAEQAIAEQCGWEARIPASAPDRHLKLLGARQCLFGDGHIAHVMYTHGGAPVSLYIIPSSQWKDSSLQVLGHHARVWSRNGRTYVLVGHEDEAALRQVAQYAQSVTH